MTTFVFVAGGWHGGWCWKRVAERLRKLGHEVHTPSLTGLADRAHLNGPNVTLQTHVDDVLGVLRWEDLKDVVLVGHSYGGMPISGVTDRRPDLIRTVVYLDALWPEDGECTADVTSHETGRSVLAMQVDPDNPPILAAGVPTAQMLGARTPEDVAWLAGKLTPQPEGAMLQPLKLARPIGHRPTMYIVCADWDPGETLRVSYRRAEKAAAGNPQVRVVTMDAPHNAMVTHPDELVEILLQA
jgi:pimeloyl-ACP methyl ester carboxylesterase